MIGSMDCNNVTFVTEDSNYKRLNSVIEVMALLIDYKTDRN